jgi:hypothetical protein
MTWSLAASMTCIWSKLKRIRLQNIKGPFDILGTPSRVSATPLEALFPFFFFLFTSHESPCLSKCKIEFSCLVKVKASRYNVLPKKHPLIPSPMLSSSVVKEKKEKKRSGKKQASKAQFPINPCIDGFNKKIDQRCSA